jgi:endogenous inhibitor of DNA gyrase (YacG/DUF329 family)
MAQLPIAYRNCSSRRRHARYDREAMRSFACAICGQKHEYEGALPSVYPFCSDRCKMVDLGNWLLGKYAIERDVTDEDEAALRAAATGGEKRAGQKRADAESD